jgi:hypothetical protein
MFILNLIFNTKFKHLSVACNRSVGFPGAPIFSNNKTDRHDITETLLKVALITIKTNQLNLILRLNIVEFKQKKLLCLFIDSQCNRTNQKSK